MASDSASDNEEPWSKEDQPARLQDMLEFDDYDDFFERKFHAYTRLYSGCGPKTLILLWVGSNHEMYWTEGSPGSEAVRSAIRLLGLKNVNDDRNSFNEAWFGKACRAEKFAALAAAGWDVRVAIHAGAPGEVKLEFYDRP
jgi:hypothetical protein